MLMEHLRVKYRRIPIITAPVIFGFSSPKGPLLSGGRYFRVAVTFGWLENVCNSAVVLHRGHITDIKKVMHAGYSLSM